MPGREIIPIEITAQDQTGAAWRSLAGHLREANAALNALQGGVGVLSGNGGAGIGGLINVIGRMPTALKVLGGAGAVIAGLGVAAVKAHGELADMGAAAKDLGLGASQLDALGKALKRAGGDAEMAASALKKLRSNSEGGDQGSFSLEELFSANDQALKNTAGTVRGLSDVYATAARMIQSAGNETDRLRIATAAFGDDAAPAMIKAILSGVDSLEKLEGKNKVLDPLTKDALEFRKVLERMQGGVGSFVDELVQKIQAYALPAIKALYSGLTSVMAFFGSKSAQQAEYIAGTPGASGGIGQREVDDFYNAVGFGKTKIPNKKEAGADTVDPFERAQDSIRKRIALVDADTRTVGLNAEAHERARVVAELEEAAIRANTAAGRDNTAVTAEQRLQIMRMADTMALATLKNREARQAWEALNETARFFGSVAGEALESFFDRTKSSAEIATNALKSFRNALLNALLTGEGPLAKALGLGNASGGAGGIFGSIAKAFSGGFATGGTIGAGRWGIVGERGPEVAFGGATGMTVFPSVGGGGGTEINVHNYSGGEATVQRSRGPDGRELINVVVAEVRRDFASGGFDGAMQRYGGRPAVGRR